MPSVKLTIEVPSLEQAHVIAEALELYVRMGLGQLGYLRELAADGSIPTGPRVGGQPATPETLEFIGALFTQAKRELGFEENGSWGIGADKVPERAKRAYETLKVLKKALAERREPAPKFKGVDYDGVIVRYTQDELPKVTMSS